MSQPSCPSYSDARFVVTGPSGWIGQAMLEHLSAAMGGRLNGRVTAFASTPREMRTIAGETLAVRALDTITGADVAGAHVIHLAYLTKEKAEELGEQRFTAINLAIDDALLGAVAEGVPRSVFVASSGAAALAETGQDRHPYGLAKLGQERRFLAAADKAAIPTIAGRIFNLAGPYINKLSSYAISNFAEQAREHGRIRIAAGTPVFRSFLHVRDLSGVVCLAGLTGVGRSGPIDLCGGEIVEMEDLAVAVAAAFGGDIAIERGPVDLTSPSLYLGKFPDTRVLALQTGVKLIPLKEQVADTLRWLQSGAAVTAGS